MTSWRRPKEVTAVLAVLACKEPKKKRTQPRALHYITTSELRKILELRAQGMSAYKIAQATGLNESTIQYHAVAAGFPVNKKRGRPSTAYCVTSRATGAVLATGTIKQCARQMCISEANLRAQKYRADDGLKSRYVFEEIRE